MIKRIIPSPIQQRIKSPIGFIPLGGLIIVTTDNKIVVTNDDKIATLRR